MRVKNENLHAIITSSYLHVTLIISILLVISYYPIFHAGFIWDDDMVLLQNPLMRSFSGLQKIWFSTQVIDYYPLTYSSFWIEYQLWGFWATGYHCVNLLLHAINALLLFVIFRQLKIPFPGFAAILFAIHPINVQSVAWITERKNVLCMFFFGLCVWQFLTFETNQRLKHYWLSLLFFVFSLLSKSAVIMFPLLIWCYHFWQKKRLLRRDFWLSMPFFYVSAIMGCISLWFQTYRAIGETIVRNDSIISRWVNGVFALGFYVQKSLFPINQSFVYPINDTQFPLHMTLPGLIIIIVFVIYCIFKRSYGGMFGFGVIFFLLFPVLGFVDIYFMRYAWVADHWQYFTLWGILGLLMIGLSFLNKIINPQYLRYLMFFWIGSFVLLTFDYVQEYHDETTLWLSTLSKYPDCALALNRLGSINQQNKNDDAARGFYQLTLKYHPQNATAHNNLGMIEASKGKLDKAMTHYATAIAQYPQHPHIHFNMAKIHMKKGRFAMAEKSLQTCINIQPGNLTARLLLASCFETQHKWSAASEVYNGIIKDYGENANILNQLARTYQSANNFFMALRAYQDSLTYESNQPEIHYQMARIYFQMDRLETAITWAKKAVYLAPKSPSYTLFLAQILGKSGNIKKAVHYLSIGLQINEHYPQMIKKLIQLTELVEYIKDAIRSKERQLKDESDQWYQLGNLYLILDNHTKARHAFKQAILKDPTHLRAALNLAWLYGMNDQLSESIQILADMLNHKSNEKAHIYHQMARLCTLFGTKDCAQEYLEKDIKKGFNVINSQHY